MSITPLPPNSALGATAAPVFGTTTVANIPVSALRRFSVEEYHALIASGFFAEDDRYELLRGLLVHKIGKNRAHSIATHRLREFLERIVRDSYVASQEPVVTSDSEPEPDVSVIRGKVEDYKTEQPPAGSAMLVAEVSDTTLAYDRGIKNEIYAEAGVPVYWIVNVVDRQIEIYSQPSGPAQQPGYASCDIFVSGQEAPVVIDGHEVGRIAVNDLLP